MSRVDGRHKSPTGNWAPNADLRAVICPEAGNKIQRPFCSTTRCFQTKYAGWQFRKQSLIFRGSPTEVVPRILAVNGLSWHCYGWSKIELVGKAIALERTNNDSRQPTARIGGDDILASGEEVIDAISETFIIRAVL